MDHAHARANPYIHCCTLVNGKKLHLYNKKIDRRKHKEILKTVLGDKYDDDFFDRNFDWTQKENCCNVIAFTLYFIEPTQEILNKFVLSIERSIKNISEILPDWVIRLYFGSSVFTYRGGTDHQIPLVHRRAFETIFSNSQVEVYRFEDDGPQLEALNIPIEHTRTTRFLSLIDPDVAFFFSHESDGCSNLLLHNLRAWSESTGMLFYLPECIKVNQVPSHITELPLFSSYSSWLYVFKSILRRYYFHNHHNIYDLLAGGFGTIIKLTGEFYTRTIAELNESVDDFGKIQETYKNMYARQKASPSPPITFQMFIDSVEQYLIPPEIRGDERTSVIQKLRLGGGRLIPIHESDHVSDKDFEEDRYGFPTTDNVLIADNDGTPIDAVLYNFRSFLYKLTSETFNASVKHNLIMGFDEMLLLDLFKRFISIKLVDETINNRGKITMAGYAGQITEIKQIIIANGDDKSCLVPININKDLLERIQNGLLRGDSQAVNELIDLVYTQTDHSLIPRLILQEGKIIQLKPGFESITYSRYNPDKYLYIYVLIDTILKYIKRSHRAINVWVRIRNQDNTYTYFNLITLLNIPFSPILGPLYDLPIDHGFVGSKRVLEGRSNGGSKRHTITSLRTKRTNRRKKRSYRSKKKSYKKHNKKTYKYKK